MGAARVRRTGSGFIGRHGREMAFEQHVPPLVYTDVYSSKHNNCWAGDADRC